MRASETRNRIIEAGVELFTDRGYGETRLNDIVDHAHVTTGAFYYHFGSKEELARTIIEQGWPKAVAVINNCMDSPNPGLEKVIVMTFALSAVMKRDKSVWIANNLNQAFGQLSVEGRRNFKEHASEFVAFVAAALRPADLRPDVSAETVGELVWILVHGCHLLSDALDDDVMDRLRTGWCALLFSAVPPEALSYFQQFVERAAAQYTLHSRN